MYQGFLLKIPVFLHESFDLSEDTPTETTTPLFHRVACGLGNVFNDIVRHLFFSFRLVYFMNVLGLSASLSGWLLLEKPLVHIALSPVSAMLVDRVYIPFVSRKIGKRKSWHLLGTVLLAVFIPFFFTTHYLIQSENSKTELMMIHLGILNIILGFGDGILDISHLSLITVIARDHMEAVEMSSLRFSFTYLSGILTFAVAWVIFGLDSESQLSESSSRDFMVLTAVLVAVGILTSLIFYLGTKEPSSSPRTPLRKISTLADTNLARLTSFIPTGALGEPMPSFAIGFKTARKESCPPRIMTRVNFCDGTQRKPTECNMNEEKMPQEEKEPPNQSFQSSSSSLLSDPYRTGVVNKGFSVSFLDLYSDDESNYTGRVGKETAPINPSAVSLETKNDLLPDTKANSQVAINSELNTANQKNRLSREKACVAFWDEIPSTPPRDDTNERQTLPNEEEAPIDNLQSWSSSLSDPDFTGVVSKGRNVSVLERYSDDKESTGTSRASKESTRSDVSGVSLDPKSVSFSQIKSDGKPVVKSCNTESSLPRSTGAEKTVRRWLIDLTSIFGIHRLSPAHSDDKRHGVRKAFEEDSSENWRHGMMLCFIFAAIFAFIAGVMSYFMEAESWTSKVMIYPAVTLLGFAFSSMFVSSLSFATELIGKNTKTTGFVFAIMTLFSSITNGSMLMTIQELFPEQRDKDCEECGDYMRLAFSVVNVAIAIVSVVNVLLLYCMNRFNGKSSSSDEDSETST
ncbi:Major facilitator superfamily domain-containing protein 12 [Acropora cervicornis]|uniref:Major facilitator superfamily domain-containing protein 12 n=1 Tax=Acropora cervicornis TaxID=6130 RepID=A0AAD9QPP2_ACRCE|nr:Major facilitator superfamily domain-containing protein 12 [Acropora cervicornis]